MRAALVGSVGYYGTLATVFVLNSWLDATVTLETEDQATFRRYLAASFGIFSFPLGFAWLRAWADQDRENYLKTRQGTME